MLKSQKRLNLNPHTLTSSQLQFVPCSQNNGGYKKISETRRKIRFQYIPKFSYLGSSSSLNKNSQVVSSSLSDCIFEIFSLKTLFSLAFHWNSEHTHTHVVTCIPGPYAHPKGCFAQQTGPFTLENERSAEKLPNK